VGVGSEEEKMRRGEMFEKMFCRDKACLVFEVNQHPAPKKKKYFRMTIIILKHNKY
jgi:hypothetical protein